MPDIFISSGITTVKPANTTNGSKNKKISTPKRFNLSSQFFSAYHFMPEGMRFETQEPGETIILLLRKHWITNLVWMLITILLLVLPVIIFPFLALSGIIPRQFPSSFLTLIILVWYLFTFSYVLVNFILWYFTVSIVTNERIIDIDFVNILFKKFAETRIARIEDVTNRTGGFIRALFDYGDVIVQTAAKEAMFLFASVPHPEAVVRIINSLMSKEGEKQE